jgi:hypothetical protein
MDVTALLDALTLGTNPFDFYHHAVDYEKSVAG